MTRYERAFEELGRRGEGAFVAFLVLGDPDPQQSFELMKTAAASGADMLELGFPFSDPLADGPTIQAAMSRALAAGMNPDRCFDLLKRFRSADDRTPIGLLVYANLVYRQGLDAFYARCRDSGVDSVLVADAPLLECRPFCEAALANGIDPVLICPPNVSDEDLEQIARLGRGYTYLLSRAGVTGAGLKAGRPVRRIIERLGELGAAPPLLGFGISRPEQVADALADGARGVICGSAVIDRIAGPGGFEERRRNLAQFAVAMKSATQEPARQKLSLNPDKSIMTGRPDKQVPRSGGGGGDPISM
jgi:tryptophan synthase alpha chain